MIVTCPGCAGKYRVRNEAVPQEGARMRCPKCETLFLAKPPVGDDASAPPAAAPPPAGATPAAPQRSLQSFQQVAPSQLQQLPTGPQMDLPKTGLAEIPAGFVVPGAGWSTQAPPQAPAPYTSPAATPRAQMQAAIPSPTMGAGNPLISPGPITGLFQSPLAQMGQPPAQRPVQVFGGAPQPLAISPPHGAGRAQPRDLLEELGLSPARPAPAPILPDDGFFDAALAGGPPSPQQAQPARRTPSSAGTLDLDGPTNAQGYIPVSLTSQPAGAPLRPPTTGSVPRPALAAAGEPPAFSSTPSSSAGGSAAPPALLATPSPSSTGKHKSVAPTPSPGAGRADVSTGAMIGSWALVTAGGAVCALGLMFAGWTAGKIDLDRELLPVLAWTFGVEAPYAFDGTSDEALDAVVQRAQAARARGDHADEVLQWTRVLQRDPRFGGAEEARRQALKALGITSGSG